MYRPRECHPHNESILPESAPDLASPLAVRPRALREALCGAVDGNDLASDRPRRGRGAQGGRALRVRIIGPGRAGSSFAHAFSAIGVQAELLARTAEVTSAGDGVDVVLVCTPDSAIASVAAAIAPTEATVMHCSGATSLDALAPHRRRASLHPLMALPDAVTGAARLIGGGWFALAGDPIAIELVQALGGRDFEVADDRRALYHATAAVASNHLVGLLGQIERLAGLACVPVEAFLDLARGSFDDVVARGARKALTGPAARGDNHTLDAHRAAVPEGELKLYNVLADACAAMAAEEE